MDKTGKIIINAEYQQVTSFHKGIAGAKKGDKWGLLNLAGKWLAPPSFDYLSFSENGVLGIQPDSSYIFDLNGRLIVASDYQALWQSVKAICFQGENIDCFLTDTKGHRLKDTYFQGQTQPNENLVAMKVADDTWSFFYETGNLAFKGTFYETLPFQENRAAVANGNEYNGGAWGFINSQGEQVIDFQYEKVASFSQGMALVKQNGLYGYIDKTGKTVITCQYLQAKDFHAGFARVQKTDKWNYINILGKEISAESYEHALDFSENVGIVFQHDKVGAIDENGKLIIPFIYDQIFPFKEGLAAAMKDGKMGYLNKKGEVSLPFAYELCYDFEKGQAKVRKNGLYGTINTAGLVQISITFQDLGATETNLQSLEIPQKWGYIDAQGNTKIPFIYQDVYPFRNGRAKVLFNGKYGYIDKTGKWIIAPIYEEAQDFRENVAAVKISVAQSDGNSVRYTYLDTMGVRLTDKLYNSATSYASDGMLIVEKESGTWLLTTKGKEIRVPIPYDIIGNFHEGAAIVTLTRKYGLINKQGKEILPCEYDYVGDLNEGFVRIFLGEIPNLDDDVRLKAHTFIGKWGFADTKGNVMLSPNYEYVLPFQNGYAKVKDKGKWGFIDKTGKLVVPCMYEQLWNLVENVARFKQNRKFGAINSAGKVIIPANYAELWEAREGLIVANFNEKYGFLDINGKTVIPFEFEDAQYFSEGKAAVMKQGKWGVIDKTGKILVAFRYEEISPYKNGISKVIENQHFGCIDAAGTAVIPAIYTAISPFHQGIAKANKGDYFQLINDKGKTLNPLRLDVGGEQEKSLTASEELIGLPSYRFSGYENEKHEETIPTIYESTYYESGGSTILVKNKGKSFALDAQGRYLVSPNEYEDYFFYLGIREDTFIFKKDGLYYNVLRNGKRLFFEGFENEFRFSEGLAAAKKGGKWGYLNTKGEWEIAPQYDWATDFVNGQARVFEAKENDAQISGITADQVLEMGESFIYPILNVKGKWGRINAKNALLIPFSYENMDDFFPNAPSRVMIGERWAYIDSKGNLLTDSLEYDDTQPFSYGLGVIRKGEKVGVVNAKGEWIVPLKYRNITIESANILFCQDENEAVFYLNNKGKPLFETGVTDAYIYASPKNLLLFKKNTLWGLADSNAKMLTPFQYDSYELAEKGDKVFVKVALNQQLGILDAKGKAILPVKYDNVERAYRDIYIVVENRKYALYDLAKQKFLCNFAYDAIARMEDGRFYAYKDGKLSYFNDDGKCVEGCEGN